MPSKRKAQRGAWCFAASLPTNASEQINNFQTKGMVNAMRSLEEDIARLIAFRNNPSDESWITG